MYAQNLGLRTQSVALFIATLFFLSCSSSMDSALDPADTETADSLALAMQAIVTAVEATGEMGSYQFKVELKSSDTGCDQYANWWEIVSAEGELIYRRILAHSHVNEQPFARSGGPVIISRTDSIIVRGHMDPTGYGIQAFTGSVDLGFKEVFTPLDFAKDLAKVDPQPDPCQF